MKEKVITTDQAHLMTIDGTLPGWMRRAVEKIKREAGTKTPIMIVPPQRNQPGVAIIPVDDYAAMVIAGLDESDPAYEQTKEWITQNWNSGGSSKR